MNRHIVASRLKADVSEHERGRSLAEPNEVRKHFHTLKPRSLGTNIGRRDDTFTNWFTVEFDTETQLLTYLGSEAHEQFVHLRPLIERRAIVSLKA